MKGFLKIIVWVAILISACIGIYMVLPEYPQSYVKSMIQPMVDTVAKGRIEAVQNLTNKDLNNATYKTILESKTENPCWIYKTDETTGTEYVVFYGRGVQINLKDWEDYGGKLSTSASVKIEFEIIGSTVNIHPYVDGRLMEITDGQHVEKNDEIRLVIFTQLFEGMNTLHN